MPADRRAVAPPRLYAALAPLCGRLVQPVGQDILLAVLNRALAAQRADGECGFLVGRTLAVAITDLRIRWYFTADAGGNRIGKATEPADATIRADSAALLLIATRRVDPDTLFFQRRLMVEGDTELGLQAKNLMDMLDPGDLPPPFARVLDQAGRVAERRAS